MARLQGKNAIVTGAASGIGLGIAQMYAQEGARVVMADRNPNGAEEAEKLKQSTRAEILFVQTDVSNSAQVQSLYEAAINQFNQLDILVNVAGVELTKCLVDTDEEDWDRIMSVNLKSVYLMSRLAVKQFISQGGGVILNMGSVTAKVGFINYPAYTASKGAIHALTRQMAMELAPYKIRVNTIFPGTIKTPLAIRNFLATNPDLDQAINESSSLHLTGRLGEPEDVAYAAVYLGSEESGFVTGQEFGIDGGFTIRGC